MDTLFDFDDLPQSQEFKDWHGNPIIVPEKLSSPNPLVVLFGVGPQGKKCSECQHFLRLRYHDYTYRKCEVRGITHGKGTDHKASFDACKKFEERAS